MTAERRQFPRATDSFDAQYRRADFHSEPWHLVKVVNFSADGLRFLGQARLDVGVALEVQIMLPMEHGATEFLLNGTVSWCNSPAAGLAEVGVEFDQMPPDQQRQLDDLVEFLLTHPRRNPPSTG